MRIESWSQHVLDNLGKGASGAAIQCMNIVLVAVKKSKGLTV